MSEVSFTAEEQVTKLTDALSRARSIMAQHLGPEKVPPGTGVKELAEMLVNYNIQWRNCVAEVGRARSIMEQHLGPEKVPPGTGVKELAEMLVNYNIQWRNCVAEVAGIKTQGYPAMGDMIHALVWAVGDSLPPEVRMLLKIISLHERTITELKQKVASLEELVEARGKIAARWAGQWLEEVQDRCDDDPEYSRVLSPMLAHVAAALEAKCRKGTPP